MNPAVAVNGTKLAKRIIIPINPKVAAYHEETQIIVRNTWRLQSHNPFTRAIRTIKVIFFETTHLWSNLFTFR